MTTHEMILLCSSFAGCRENPRYIPLFLVPGFATLVAFGNFGHPPPRA